MKQKMSQGAEGPDIGDLSVAVCMGPAAVAEGGGEVIKAFHRELGKYGIKAPVRKKCITGTGCHGLCAKDVLVDVMRNNEAYTYEFVKPGMVGRIVREHIISNKPVREWLAGPDYREFHDRQIKILLRQCGRIDPEDIGAYIRTGGYEGLRKALSWTPARVIAEVKASGLRGRGGAGFPTGLKWEACSRAGDTTRYIICNADEGDPGAFMDRAVILGNPHSIIEGMIIGAYAIGAHEGYIYVRSEYPLSIIRLESAIRQARKKGFLGRNILKSGFGFNIFIKKGAGAFVCGEETALMASIEGRRGMPRAKPPFPVSRGLWGRPTVINNVETLANIGGIIARGAPWYASTGSEKSRGTKLFSLTGRIKNTGLIEVPIGITLREIIYGIGGGMESSDRTFKAVQTGGPSGGCIPASHIDIPVDYESLTGIGSMMGSGGMVVMDDTTCMVEMARFFLDFTRRESCGKCTPCRIGTRRMLEILVRITSGGGREGDIELLTELATDIKLSSLCGLGQTAPNPVLSSINFFRDEYEAHIRDRICPAGVCRALRRYVVNADICTMCGKCSKVCPSGAIAWEKKQAAVIDRDKCIKCGACYEACRFNAIM